LIGWGTPHDAVSYTPAGTLVWKARDSIRSRVRRKKGRSTGRSTRTFSTDGRSADSVYASLPASSRTKAYPVGKYRPDDPIRPAAMTATAASMGTNAIDEDSPAVVPVNTQATATLIYSRTGPQFARQEVSTVAC
jgi:hypothetical protein